MKKKVEWVRSAIICMAVVAVMLGAGFYLLSDGNDTMLAGGKVEAAMGEQIAKNEDIEDKDEQTAVVEEMVVKESESEDRVSAKSDDNSADNEEVKAPASGGSSGGYADPAEEKTTEPAAAKQTAAAPVDYKAEETVEQNQTESLPVEAENEEPAAVPAPAVAEETTVVEEPQQVTVAPVTYSWGSSRSYVFRIEVSVTNSGNDTSRNVKVAVPLLENSSPYQTTTLQSVNYDEESTSGRIGTFSLGDLAPGETKTIRADFDITVRPVSINSTNKTVEKAREAYDMYAGSGNCRTLAIGFINKAREMGIEAREVIGFARPQRGPMTSGSLQGTRHSWAEFYVDGLGWVPVDLTFQYFGSFPHTSHIIESYSDQSIRVNYTGGSLGASWSNIIL